VCTQHASRRMAGWAKRAGSSVLPNGTSRTERDAPLTPPPRRGRRSSARCTASVRGAASSVGVGIAYGASGGVGAVDEAEHGRDLRREDDGALREERGLGRLSRPRPLALSTQRGVLLEQGTFLGKHRPRCREDCYSQGVPRGTAARRAARPEGEREARAGGGASRGEGPRRTWLEFMKTVSRHCRPPEYEPSVSAGMTRRVERIEERWW
jgi:hypothetical protein